MQLQYRWRTCNLASVTGTHIMRALYCFSTTPQQLKSLPAQAVAFGYPTSMGADTSTADVRLYRRLNSYRSVADSAARYPMRVANPVPDCTFANCSCQSRYVWQLRLAGVRKQTLARTLQCMRTSA